MVELHPRVRAVCDLGTAEARFAGLHEYDGHVADLSPSGVRGGLAKVGDGQALTDPHDEAHLRAVEGGLRVRLAELQTHRVNPLVHLDELDLSGYEREYAPAAERAAARDAHLARWPQAVNAALEALDRVPAPVAAALLPAARGLAAGVPEDVAEHVRGPALEAHGRLVAHLERAEREGEPSAALGAPALSRLMGVPEAVDVDLDRLAQRADAERDRLAERLAEAAGRIDPARPALEVARELVRDHPDISGVLDAARDWTRHTIAFTRERDLVPYHDGECVVDISPPSQRWSVAMLMPSAPHEAEGPTYYYVTPPDAEWTQAEAEEWLQLFSATTLPAITAHEVAPGHFSHCRALRYAPTQVRRTFASESFIEGWAHYAEELTVEEGFGAYAERAVAAEGGGGGWTAAHYEVGVWLEALIRVTRLACAIGIHTGAMTVEDAARRFESDTSLAGPAALSEARRATFDPTYGRYTWGKLEIMALREQAREAWGAGFTLRRFHTALFELGSPPLGLMGRILE